MVTLKWHITLFKMVSPGQYSRLSLTQPRELLARPIDIGTLRGWGFGSAGTSLTCTSTTTGVLTNL